MTIKINAAEELIIKDALKEYQSNLVDTGTKYNTIVDILNKINDAGIIKADRTPRVIVNKEYMFSFEEGGWNTVWAKTLPGAKRKALLEYKDSSLTPRLDTVKRAGYEEIQSAASLFY